MTDVTHLLNALEAGDPQAIRRRSAGDPKAAAEAMRRTLTANRTVCMLRMGETPPMTSDASALK